MRRRVRGVALIVALAAGTAGAACGGSTTSGNEAVPGTTGRRPRVVATTTILGSLVHDLAGDAVDLDVLTPPEADPAIWPGDPSVPDRLAQADLVVAIGLDYEAALRPARALPSTGAPRVLKVAEQLAPTAYGVGRAYAVPPPPGAAGAPAPGAPDPAVWLDPDRLTAAAGLVASALLDLPPPAALGDADTATHLAGLTEALRVADEDMQVALGPLPSDRREVITDDPRLGYLAERYGLTIRAPGEGRPPLPVVIHTYTLGPPGSGADTLPGLLVTDARALGTALTGALQTKR